MAARLIWTQEALDDVEAIANYINRDSPYHARRVVQALFTLAETVGDQPKLGRTVPELNDKNVRERFLYSYRVIYTLRDDAVFVLGVIHGHRLLEAITDRFAGRT